MNYLAFDIEAANGFKAYSICSIGVVVADENLNVLRSENIWINPKSKYNLNGTRRNVGIDLKLDKELLERSPDFSQVYDRVKSMLEDEENVVVGHAVDADVRMLNAACKRYHLPPLKFDFICTQLLYRLYKNEKEVKGLNKIAVELGLEFAQHNSQSDAWMSLMTLKYLVEDSGLSVFELLKKSHVRIGNTENFEIVRPVCLSEQLSKKSVTRQALNNIKNKTQHVKVKSHKLSGVFAIARSLELDKDSVALVKTIAENGGVYTSHLGKCDYYIKADEQGAQDVMREKYLDELQKKKKVVILSRSELINILNRE